MTLRSISLRTVAQKGVSGFEDRAERLRRGRATAPPLREMFPLAAHVAVRLQFHSNEAPSHADQSFELYPGARAYFGFPCPYGDCDGIYDLGAAARSALECSAAQATGTLECGGTRSRHRMPGQPCGLEVSYTVIAEHRAGAPNADLSPFA